ncbi:thioesterase family protein [Prescottella equi]|uniref:Thioesterase family protein n=1 Tax=Rhodococcus hoagii TaxID=43767 RepID=A0A9Q4ZIW6_RHOHA|nr:thioesterase family protein [Prescottella equi]MCD7051565.1 thioesterase family protein [Rhodococcus sp. BH2-1]MBM4489184.1 thioesterase family protein [Prescottella equi]MBM4497344.1 thioesterase family protein [Prescottella equi]MBM4498349.1 thioesterase family protein [Prescottella equi]MBM4507121.1 thioesterase family protein [Prescottella equi]
MTQIVAPTHPFDVAVELSPELGAPGVFLGHTSPAYANMVGPFGGITAATLLRAVLQHPERLGDPLSLTVNFAGPIADGAFEVSARPTRTNRSTQHWNIELAQDGVVTTTATAVFGNRRDTWASTEIEAPPAPPADDVAAAGFPDFIAWARNYEMRFVTGELPTPEAGGQPDSTTTMWVRDAPPRALDFPALTSLCDVFYPRAFLRLGRYLPAGTVSLTVYFHADATLLAAQADDAVLATARAQRFGKGYFDQSGEIWGHDGALLATTHQLVYFKD